jgi:cobalamin biosynthesis Mg chelatase CobN
VGSSGSKPRKKKQHQQQQHLPKVGSKANEDYEFQERRQEVFRGTPMIIVAIVLVLVLIGWVIITI